MCRVTWSYQSDLTYYKNSGTVLTSTVHCHICHKTTPVQSQSVSKLILLGRRAAALTITPVCLWVERILTGEVAVGFVLLANGAFAQASILWITMTPLLFKFNSYCEARYGSAVRHMPLETAAAAPPASIPAVVYMPPALRKGAAGWYPEFGKVERPVFFPNLRAQGKLQMLSP